MEIPEITVNEAKEFFLSNSADFIDVRDPQSFETGHIPGALHVNDNNLEEFLLKADKSKHHIVYCYHGNSSMGGTAYFLENGFKKVQSLTGGFGKWSELFPDQIEPG